MKKYFKMGVKGAGSDTEPIQPEYATLLDSVASAARAVEYSSDYKECIVVLDAPDDAVLPDELLSKEVSRDDAKEFLEKHKRVSIDLFGVTRA